MGTHIYHYNTHSEKRYFLGQEHHGLYDIIALNGNIVSHSPKGVAGFLATAGKDFYIDPQTHAFQHATIHLKKDVSDKEKKEEPRFEFKPSIEKLAYERLGEPFSKVIKDDKPIRTQEFLDNDNIRSGVIDSVCQKVVTFQLNMMEDELDDEEKEFMEGACSFRPKFVIAPYFCLSAHHWRKWLKINIACYRKMRTLVEDLPVYLSLVMSKEAMRNHSTITEAISAVKPDGIMLWIDEHVEEDLIVSEVSRYIDFLQNLKNATDIIYNSHGGYLSVLLCHSEAGELLSGVAHSVNYGEHRGVVPVGGGLPMARFYLRRVHSRLRWGDAAGIVQKKGWLDSIERYRDNVCRCHQCQELLKEKGSGEKAFALYGESNPVTITRRDGRIVRLNYPTKEAKQAATRHYLYNKAKEFEDIENEKFDDLLEDLMRVYNEISPDLGDDFIAHLPVWHDALKKLE